MQNLASLYRPQKLSEVVEQSVVVDIVKNICEAEEVSNRNFLFIGPAGTGKALPNDELVLIYDGFKPMGEIKVGEKVITHTGAVAEVTGVFPQGVRPTYKITLEDGACIHVSDNHLNLVTRVFEGGITEEVVTTDYLLSHNYEKFSIPLADIDEHLDRLGLVDSRRKSTYRRIVSITFDGNVECTCIYVDHPDHTFISRDFIPSHNTTTARIIANALNQGQGEPIEIDAASHSGVDSARELVSQMQSYPVGCKYKVFIIDECFPGSTLIQTEVGPKPIKDVTEDDVVYNLRGKGRVNKVFVKEVPREHLCYVMTTSGNIMTTRDHYFFTQGGWFRAKQLFTGVTLYNFADVEGEAELHHGLDFPYEAHMSMEGISSSPILAFSNFTKGEFEQVESSIAKNLKTTTRVLGVVNYSTLSRWLFEDEFPGIATSRTVKLYDLEVEGHPSYFANNFLVHNCHSLSSAAWQVLLKAIEEQPARSVTAFCTTNPEKIPATILSRVQTFQLSKISLEGIFGRLKYIIEEENKKGRGITYEDDALLFIAKKAAGGMRDSITSLDQCLSFSTNITMETVMRALDLPNYDDYFDLLNAIAKKDNENIVKIINNVYNSGSNFTKWFDGFFSFVTNIVKFIYIQDINQTMIPSIYQDKISKYGVAHSALCLKLSNKLVKMNQELKTSSYLQELAISYLCTPPSVKKG